MVFRVKIGARYLGNGNCEFTVWGPFLKEAAVRIIAPEKRTIPMERGKMGYWKILTENVLPGTLYFYHLNGSMDRPDPASIFQPRGVHGPSQVLDQSDFQWKDQRWSGMPLEELIIYELHVGTFTNEGTFEGVASRLKEIQDLGANSIQIMPVAQFPGNRNWGYDGADLFAVQNSYGGPDRLKELVDACHARRMAVVLDVVYNHLGPEGNYLKDFGPYFTEKYKTPWGAAINFDDAYSDEVRNFFIQNALLWLKDYHVDALRLDAVHSIFDMSAKPFLQELKEKVEEFSRKRGGQFYLIAESDLNDIKIIRPRELGGYGIDAQFSEDFHHSLHALLTGEDKGYYSDFGKVEHLIKALKEGFVYSWQYSQYRMRHYGSSSKDVPGRQFVVFLQNHDQVGNRMLGERLSKLVSFEALKLAAGTLLVSPFIPLIFMGEEYGEESPFLYFTSHSDPDLAAAVRNGRISEFQAFKWHGEPPDPQSPNTFRKSKLGWEKRNSDKYGVLLQFYRHMIELRKKTPAMFSLDKKNMEVSGSEQNKLIFIQKWNGSSRIFCIMNFNPNEVEFNLPILSGRWGKLIDSSEKRWLGPGSKISAILDKNQRLVISPKGFALFGMVKQS